MAEAHGMVDAVRAPKFLVIRLSSLGDLVHTIPAVAALRQTFPNAKLDWVVEKRWMALLRMIQGVDEIIPIERSLAGQISCIRRLRQARYQCAIDFQGLYKSALLARFSGAPRRIGRSRRAAREPGAAMFYNERVNPQGAHVAEMSMSLARAAGARADAIQFPLRVPDSEIRALEEWLLREGIADYVLLSPGGGWQSKCWPPERYGALCAELWRRHGVRSVVNAGPGEEELAQEVARAAGEAKPLALTPSLPELAALLAKARSWWSRPTPGRCIWPRRWARAMSRSLAPLILRATARCGAAWCCACVHRAEIGRRADQRGNYERGDDLFSGDAFA